MPAQIKALDEKWLTMTWLDGRETRHYSPWLRATCFCFDCKNQVTFQKTAFPENINFHDPLVSATLQDDVLTLKWEKGDRHHIGTVPLDEIRKSEQLRDGHVGREPPVWKGSPLEKFSYPELIQNKEVRFEFLSRLAEYGICLIQNAPVDETVSKEFELKVESEIVNVAHTTLGLPLHEDLVYYESVPGFQLMQCLQFDDCIVGGDSRFSDAFLAAKELKEKYPDDYKALVSIPATFQKINKYHFSTLV